MSVPFLRESLARLHAAADAMKITAADIRLQDFSAADQTRFLLAADEDIRAFINRDDPVPVQKGAA